MGFIYLEKTYDIKANMYAIVPEMYKDNVAYARENIYQIQLLQLRDWNRAAVELKLEVKLFVYGKLVKQMARYRCAILILLKKNL